MNTIDAIISDVVMFLNKLDGLPALVLVFITCIAFGYVLKLWGTFPNTGIPFAVCMFGAIIYPFVADPTINMGLHVWIIRNAMIGFITGFSAWVVHNSVIKKIEEKLNLFKGANEKIAD